MKSYISVPLNLKAGVLDQFNKVYLLLLKKEVLSGLSPALSRKSNVDIK